MRVDASSTDASTTTNTTLLLESIQSHLATITEKLDTQSTSIRQLRLDVHALQSALHHGPASFHGHDPSTMTHDATNNSLLDLDHHLRSSNIMPPVSEIGIMDECVEIAVLSRGSDAVVPRTRIGSAATARDSRIRLRVLDEGGDGDAAPAIRIEKRDSRRGDEDDDDDDDDEDGYVAPPGLGSHLRAATQTSDRETAGGGLFVPQQQEEKRRGSIFAGLFNRQSLRDNKKDVVPVTDGTVSSSGLATTTMRLLLVDGSKPKLFAPKPNVIKVEEASMGHQASGGAGGDDVEVKIESVKSSRREIFNDDSNDSPTDSNQKLNKGPGSILGISDSATVEKNMKGKGSLSTRARALVRPFLIEHCYCPMFNEFRESFRGSVERRFWIETVDTERLGGFHPTSLFVVVWKFFMSLFYIFALAVIPFVLSFESLGAGVRSAVSYTISATFFVDLLINFNTLALVDRSTSIRTLTLPDSRRRYLLSTGLILDLIAVIPFSEIVDPSLDYFIIIQLIGVRHIYSIFAHNAIHHKIAGSLSANSSAFTSVFLSSAILLLFFHYHACLIFFMGKISAYSDSFWALPESLAVLGRRRPADQYVFAMFKTIANTFPLTGFVPTGTVEQIITILAVLIGAVLYASLVGVISSFSLGMDTSGRKFKEIMDEVNEYMEDQKLPAESRNKVRQLFQIKYHGKYFNKDAIYAQMNKSLREEIIAQTMLPLISKVSFLSRKANDGRDNDFTSLVASVLRPEFYIKDDIIIQQNDVGKEMFFIERGTVEIVFNGIVVGALRDGAFFGEVALLSKAPRTASIRAASNCKLYRLYREDLEPILSIFPDVAANMRAIFEERMQQISANRGKMKQQQGDEKTDDSKPKAQDG